MIFGINTTTDISKLLYVISRAVRRVKFETILKYHEWYLCQISRTNHVYTTTCKRFVIFTCRYFKLSWNTTALSQSNCRNFSRSSINDNTISNRISTNTKLLAFQRNIQTESNWLMMMMTNKIYSNFFFLSLLAMPPGKIEATLLSPLVFRVMQGAYFVTTEYQKSKY